MKKLNLYRVFILLLAGLLFSMPVMADNLGFGKVELPFKPELQLKDKKVYTGGKTELVIRFDFPKNHYLYKDKTSVSLQGVQGLKFGTPVYPKAVKAMDKFSNKEKEIYPASFTIKVPVEVTAKTAASLSITSLVKFQGCSETICFLPQSKELKASVEIVKKK